MNLCENDYFALPVSLYASVTISVFYLVAEILCILCCIRVLRRITVSEEIVLIPMMITLNVTLVLQMFSTMSGIHPFCYNKYWFKFFQDVPSVSRDICILCLLVKVWDYLKSLEGVETTYDENTKFTYLFMIVHFFVGYIILVIEDAGFSNNVLDDYMAIVQITIIFVFGYAFYKLFVSIRENSDSTVQKDVLVMNVISVVVFLTLIARVAYDLSMEDEFNIRSSTLKWLDLILEVLSSLVPCCLITLILFNQQVNLKQSILEGSSFTKDMP